jgi:hypothetical protein
MKIKTIGELKKFIKDNDYKRFLFAAYLQGKRDQIYWSTKWEE